MTALGKELAPLDISLKDQCRAADLLDEWIAAPANRHAWTADIMQTCNAAACKFIARLGINFRPDDFSPVGTALTVSGGSSRCHESIHSVVSLPLPRTFV